MRKGFMLIELMAAIDADTLCLTILPLYTSFVFLNHDEFLITHKSNAQE